MLATGARLQSCAGIAEFTGGHLGQRFGRLGRCGFSAMTLGHVVLATSQADLAVLRAHEQVHVGQYERWGPLCWCMAARLHQRSGAAQACRRACRSKRLSR